MAAWASCRVGTRPRRTSSVSSRRRAPLVSWRPSWSDRFRLGPPCVAALPALWHGWPTFLRRAPGSGSPSWRQRATWPSCRPGSSTPLAVLVACVVTPLAVLPAFVRDALGRLAGLRGDVLGGAAPGLGRLLQDLGHLVGQGLEGLRRRSSRAGWPPRGAPARGPARWSCGSARPSCPPTPVPGCAGCLRRSPTLARSPRPGHG